jgi:hypothetical protein
MSGLLMGGRVCPPLLENTRPNTISDKKSSVSLSNANVDQDPNPAFQVNEGPDADPNPDLEPVPFCCGAVLCHSDSLMSFIQGTFKLGTGKALSPQKRTSKTSKHEIS